MTERGRNPRSLENLDRHKWQKGQSGNPQGRPPKELCITDLTREQLGQPCPKDPSKSWAKYLSDKWLDLACENVQAFRELMERLEGKVVFPIAAQTETEVHWIIGKGYATQEDVVRLDGQPLLQRSESAD